MAFAVPGTALFAAPRLARLRQSAGAWRFVLPLALLLAGALCFQLTKGSADRATETAPVATAPIGSLTGNPLPIDAGALAGALLVVGGLIAALPLVARRVTSAARGRGAIEVVEARPLGGRRALLLVRVDGRQVLVGSSEAGLSMLCELGGAPFSRALAEELAVPAASAPSSSRAVTSELPR